MRRVRVRNVTLKKLLKHCLDEVSLEIEVRREIRISSGFHSAFEFNYINGNVTM